MNILILHRCAFCQFLFRWIHYNGSNKSTGLETGKSHLCVLGWWKANSIVVTTVLKYRTFEKRNFEDTKVQFASFQSGGFITVTVGNPLENKLAKRTSVEECNSFSPEFYRDRTKIQDLNKKNIWNFVEIFFHTRSVIPFHQNFTATLPKFRTFSEGL